MASLADISVGVFVSLFLPDWQAIMLTAMISITTKFVVILFVDITD